MSLFRKKPPAAPAQQPADEAPPAPPAMFSDVIKCPTNGCPCWVGIKTGKTSGTCECGATVRP